MAPDWRAARKCGSSGVESGDTKEYTSRSTLPAAHSRPTSGPPQLTTVRPARRTPPADAEVAAGAHLGDGGLFGAALVGHRLRLRVRGALLDERVTVLVGHPREVQLEGEALLVAVRALHVPEVDAVEALLG